MKPFDLKEALNGAPINVKGEKCYVLRDVTDLLDNPKETRYLVVFPSNHTDAELWTEDYFEGSSMWEEPELTSEQVLEKAYKEGLLVENENYVGVFEVFAKTNLGNYVIGFKGGNSFYQIVIPSENGWRLHKTEALKPDTITVTLPKPFKPKPNDKFWFIDKVGGHLQVSHKIKSNHALTGDGNYFRTKSDAQAWLDAMKNALDD
ncbi:hypothetical protein DPW02_11945 [Aggregatibacter aphrophilus]|nr:hypothetical protein DPW02_11945 [Aggregatibacter aphrophilus]